MPRPGPRPYECVRRAWHSERHQPMRGSLIKEIFRIAHEVHSPSTKKNKEWQEKLPIVVLKAEEIIYSKANSEAEYMDPKTLWERVNDAIDTIIRRDGSDETGEFLQPCIEAALNLGCIPRKASRSQRNTNPRFYLSSYSLGRDNGPLKPTASPLASQCPNFLNPTMPTSKIPAKDPPQNCDFRLLNGDLNMLPVPTSLHSSSYSPYHPSCYGTHPGFVDLPTMNPTPSFVNDWMLETGMMENTSPCDKDSSTMMIEDYPPEEVVCDLSLRLAPLSVSAPEHETKKRRAMEVVEDQQFSWQPKLLCTYSAGSARIAGQPLFLAAIVSPNMSLFSMHSWSLSIALSRAKSWSLSIALSTDLPFSANNSGLNMVNLKKSGSNAKWARIGAPLRQSLNDDKSMAKQG